MYEGRGDGLDPTEDSVSLFKGTALLRMAVWYGGGGWTAAKSPYDWRRNAANDGTPSDLDWSNWTGETMVDDGRAGDVTWTCDVEEVGVPFRLESDCAGDLWEEGGDEVSEKLGDV